MARRFPLYTDENVQGPLLKALKRQGWDIVRAVEIYPEGTPDDTHFEYAVQQGLVLVTNDGPLHSIAHRWLREGRPFPGMIARAVNKRLIGLRHLVHPRTGNLRSQVS